MKTQISLRSFATSRIRVNSCNSCLLSALLCVPLRLCGCLLFLQSAFAATNDLATALQKGLFEEEANHNFPAAIEAYQGVINHFDEDRKLAATAIFRLGEIYRKQGKTNEATAQYERVVREFSDQPTLATLSQSYLAAGTAGGNASTNNVASEPMLTSDEAEQVRKIRLLIRDSPDLVNAKDGGGNTRLHNAANLGHLVVAQFLIENGADVNARNQYGQTPLFVAAQGGHKALVELLLSHGGSVQIVGYGTLSGETPLHAAARKGFRSIVELLLAHGADVNAKTTSGSTPLHLAVANSFKSVAELLLNRGADPNAQTSDAGRELQHTFIGSPLHIAAQRDDQPIAELLLANKASPNVTNSTGDMPLHLTSQRGNEKLTELLLANKARVDPINNAGETPLALAAKAGFDSTASLLLSHGADVNFRNPVEGGWKGWTPLHYAVVNKKVEMGALLLNKGADPNAKIANAIGEWARGATALIIAASLGEPDIVASLLDAKADPNLKDDLGLTPARAAMRTSNTPNGKRIISLLLDHGANTETPDSEGKTLLMLAVEYRNKEIVEMLLAHKADVNAQNPHGDTPLHIAIISLFQNQFEFIPAIAELLLSAGADVNLQNKDGKTPLNWLLNSQKPFPSESRFASYTKVLDILQTHGAVADLPRLDAIELRRPEANFPKVIFIKGTNGWDQFTLFDLIGVQYNLLSASPAGGDRSLFSGNFTTGTGLDFPDFKRVRIRHPKPDFKTWDERKIDIDTALTSGDCSADVPLELGDQVEIPEADHILGARWDGLNPQTLETLSKCLTRQVTVIVKGKSNTVTLGPDISFTTNLAGSTFEQRLANVKGTAGTEARLVQVGPVRRFAPFMIRPALAESKLLLASSDLAHIKLIRTDSATGQKRELIVDCSNNAPAPSVWLRDGDIIEVPDKP
jgi:ankyrin repeat protein